MDNLKPMRVRNSLADIDGQIIHISVDEDKKQFYLENNNLLVRTGDKKEILYDPEENIIRVEYMHRNKLCLLTANKLVVIDYIPREAHATNFDEEVVEISWNNSFDFFAAVFVNNTVKTYIFTPTCEFLLHGSGSLFALVPELETIGWGSENTQFQIDRSGQEEIKGCVQIPPTDHKKPFISWAENKSEFVVCFIENNTRKFKVFDHLCLAKTVSKSPGGELYGPVAWKPQGNIIAAASFFDKENCVMFFEQNGLARHILPLRQLPFPIISLSWSTCGSVLCVTQEDDSKQKHISLYAVSNYRWFMKQHLLFPDDNFLYRSSWLSMGPKCMELVVITKKQIVQYKYRFEFQRHNTNKTIATIDGKTVIFFNFMDSVNPPPTTPASIDFPNAINMIEFHKKNEMMAAIDDSNYIYLLSTKTNVQIISKTFLYEQIFPLNVNHLFWKLDSPHVIIDNNSLDYKISLYEFDKSTQCLVENQDFKMTSNDIEELVCVEGIIIVFGANKRSVFCEGTITTTTFAMDPLQVTPFLYREHIYCFVLTTDEELCIDEEFFAKRITSVMIFAQHLLFTNDSSLYTIELTPDNIANLPRKGLQACHQRPLNEMMYLIAMAGNNTSIVLYTSRGTLDVVSSLPLEIKFINDKISEDAWEEVIVFMRSMRTNWNFLIDLNSKKFYSNFEKIIKICDRKGVLNAFVDEICNQDYGNARHAMAIIPPTHGNRTHEFFTHLDSLFARGGGYCQYFPTIMKLCLDRVDLKRAMLYASNLRKASINLLEKAVKLLKIRVEPIDLFNASLQIFDLDLAAYVATQCQMNPQEVDPILENLNRLNEVDRRVAIHLRFKNWEGALPYMLRSKTCTKQEVISHIQTYDLSKRAYREALALNSPYLYEIVHLYVDKLSRAKLYKEAAVLCAQHDMNDEALTFFKYALDHVKCIEYLESSELNPDSKKDFLKDLAQQLVLRHRIEEAAVIYDEHLDDPQSAVNALIVGNKFATAVKICKHRRLKELLANQIMPKLLERISDIVGMIAENNQTFSTYSDRLKKLRYKKKLLQAHMSVGGSIPSSIPLSSNVTRANQMDDVESIITFGSSVSSSASSSSRKMLRKLERQKQDTTEGSRFEDIAMIREMHMLLTAVFQFGDEIREALLLLIELRPVEIYVLHDYQTEILTTQQKMIEEAKIIWSEDFNVGSDCKYIAENISFLDEKYRTPPPELKVPGTSWGIDVLKW